MTTDEQLRDAAFKISTAIAYCLAKLGDDDAIMRDLADVSQVIANIMEERQGGAPPVVPQQQAQEPGVGELDKFGAAFREHAISGGKFVGVLYNGSPDDIDRTNTGAWMQIASQLLFKAAAITKGREAMEWHETDCPNLDLI